MEIQYDKTKKKQPYIRWVQYSCPDKGIYVYKRAWIRETDEEGKDWAKTGKYINVVRCDEKGNPAGNPTDFPIYVDTEAEHTPSAEQILISFVTTVNGITGCSFNSPSPEDIKEV